MSIKLEEFVTILSLLAVRPEAYAASSFPVEAYAHFTVVNNCGYPVWPVFLSNAGIEPLATGDFELQPGASCVMKTPVQWSGLVGANGKDNCSIADMDHLPILEVATRSTGAYMARGSIVGINISGTSAGMGCEGECESFGSTHYYCIEAYAMSKPSAYSQLFKNTTFTCSDAYFALTFCPFGAMDSEMSSTSSPLATRPTANGAQDSSNNGPGRIIGSSKEVISTGAPSSPTSTSGPSSPTSTSGLIIIIISLLLFLILICI